MQQVPHRNKRYHVYDGTVVFLWRSLQCGCLPSDGEVGNWVNAVLDVNGDRLYKKYTAICTSTRGIMLVCSGYDAETLELQHLVAHVANHMYVRYQVRFNCEKQFFGESIFRRKKEVFSDYLLA